VSAAVAGIVEPALDVVPAGDHVVVEQREMSDVVLVRPPPDPGPHGLLRGGGRHGSEGTRSEPSADRTASLSS
jgi:hypothetical protein